MIQQIKKRRIIAIMKKEFIQIRRDKRSLSILIFLPIFMLVMFGYALTFDVKNIRMAIFDHDRTEASREYIGSLENSGFFLYTIDISNESQVQTLLDNKKVVVVLVIPHGFSADLVSGKETHLQALIDGSNANEATQVLNYLTQIASNYNQQLRTDFTDKKGIKIEVPIVPHPRVWYNPELRSSRYLIPGLIVYIMSITSVISTAVSIVREKERKTMEQIKISPALPLEIILGKTIPYLLMSLFASYMILTFGYLLFGATVTGSHIELFFVILLFLIAGLTMGLFISTVAPNQQVAFLASLIVTILPTILLSGFIWPISSMHPILQVISSIMPARYFLDILRSIIIKGTGVSAYWVSLFALSLFTVFIIAATRKKIQTMLE